MDFSSYFKESLGFLISKTSASMRYCFNREIREKGIDATAEQWGLLNIIYAVPGIIQSDIAKKTLKDKTNITRMLDLLEKNGYIERQSDEHDRRSYRIFITGKGKSMLRELMPVAVRVNQKAVKGLTEKEVQALFRILSKIFNNTRE